MVDARRFTAHTQVVSTGVFKIPASVAVGERRERFRARLQPAARGSRCSPARRYPRPSSGAGCWSAGCWTSACRGLQGGPGRRSSPARGDRPPEARRQLRRGLHQRPALHPHHPVRRHRRPRARPRPASGPRVSCSPACWSPTARTSSGSWPGASPPRSARPSPRSTGRPTSPTRRGPPCRSRWRPRRRKWWPCPPPRRPRSRQTSGPAGGDAGHAHPQGRAQDPGHLRRQRGPQAPGREHAGGRFQAGVRGASPSWRPRTWPGPPSSTWSCWT